MLRIANITIFGYCPNIGTNSHLLYHIIIYIFATYVKINGVRYQINVT